MLDSKGSLRLRDQMLGQRGRLPRRQANVSDQRTRFSEGVGDSFVLLVAQNQTGFSGPVVQPNPGLGSMLGAVRSENTQRGYTRHLSASSNVQ